MAVKAKKLSKEEILKLAVRFFLKKEYKKALDLLEPIIFSSQDLDIFAYKLYVILLLYINEIEVAQKYVEKILANNPDDVEALNALAYIYLKQRKVVPAVNALLDAEYAEPQNQMIKNNLDILKQKNTELLLSTIKPYQFLFLRIPEKYRKESILEKLNKKTSLVLAIIFVLIIGGIMVLLIPKQNPQELVVEDIKRKKIERITIGDIKEVIERSKALQTYRELSEKEIKDKFEELKKLLKESLGKSNKARYIANYLLNSNAHPLIKENVKILKDYLVEPEVTSLDYNPSLKDIESNPELYMGVYVLWKGKVLGYKKEREGKVVKTYFNMLVYGEGGFFDGVMIGVIEGEKAFEAGEDIRVFGEVVGYGKYVVVDVKYVFR